MKKVQLFSAMIISLCLIQTIACSGTSSTGIGNNESETATSTGSAKVKDPNGIEGYYRYVLTAQCEGVTWPMEEDSASITYAPYEKDGLLIQHYSLNPGGFNYSGDGCTVAQGDGSLPTLCEKCSASGNTVTFSPCRTPQGCAFDWIWTKTRNFESN